MLLASIGDERSKKLGCVFVRDHVYNFNPMLINEFYQNPDDDEERRSLDIHDATATITGGFILGFSDHPHSISVANLTYFYYVLHKTTIIN